MSTKQPTLSCPEMCIEPRTPIYFYYRLIRLAPISIYKLSTSYLQAPCSNGYLGYRRILNNAHRTSRKKWPKFPNLVPDMMVGSGHEIASSPGPSLRGKRAWYTPTAHAPVCTQNLGTSYIPVKYSVNYHFTITSSSKSTRV